MITTTPEAFHLGSITGLAELQGDPQNIGPWLALKDIGGRYEVIARGSSADEVYKIALRQDVKNPVVTKVPEPDTALFL